MQFKINLITIDICYGPCVFQVPKSYGLKIKFTHSLIHFHQLQLARYPVIPHFIR